MTDSDERQRGRSFKSSKRHEGARPGAKRGEPSGPSFGKKSAKPAGAFAKRSRGSAEAAPKSFSKSSGKPSYKASAKPSGEPAGGARPRSATRDAPRNPNEGERIAKVMARAGACSRRDAEAWIAAGRIAVNGRTLESPAYNVTAQDRITVDGKPLAARERTRLFAFHKPRGYVTTDHDPEGRATIFDYLAERHPDLPRLMTIGRLDINTEGLLLLTNDGGLARVLELPATGWLRRYRVRAHGATDQAALDTLANGVAIDGVRYAPIEARLDREQGANTWLTLALREGKNREVRRVLGSLDLEVNRLIRVSYGPFQLGDLDEGAVEEIKTRVLRDQLGPTLIAAAQAEFDSPTAEERREEERREEGRHEEGRRGEGRRGDDRRGDDRRETAPQRPAREGGRPPRAAHGAVRPDRAPRSERAPYAERAPRQTLRGPRGAEREEPPAPRRERPKAGPRKHVSLLREEREARQKAGEPRVRLERSATTDRKGRAVTVERVAAAAPKRNLTTRNGRRFHAERDEARDQPTRTRPSRPAPEGQERRPRPPRAAPEGQERRPRPLRGADEGGMRPPRRPRSAMDGAPARAERSAAPRRFERTDVDRPARSRAPAGASGGAPARTVRGERAGNAAGRPAGKPAGRPAGKPTGRPGGKPAGRPGGKPAGRPGGKPAGKLGGGKSGGGKPGGGKGRPR